MQAQVIKGKLFPVCCGSSKMARFYKKYQKSGKADRPKASLQLEKYLKQAISKEAVKHRGVPHSVYVKLFACDVNRLLDRPEFSRVDDRW